MSKPYGSGYFGEWKDGEHGLPAYLYTVNQLEDKKAVTQTNPAWRDKRDHTFMFGNDRVTVTASNFGYVQIRQDEGCPKFLTDYNPKKYSYGGGFGYLVSDRETLSTFYNGQNMIREYGAGYFKKTTEGKTLAVTETLFSPFGDDPVVLKKVTVKNKSAEKASLRWYDYWSGEMYQFAFTHFAAAQVTFNTANVSRLRRAFSASFDKSIDSAESAVSQKWIYNKNKKPFVRLINSIGDGFLWRMGRRFYDMENASSVDYNPPKIAVTASEPLSGVITDPRAFFGKGGVNSPAFSGGTGSGMLTPFIDFTLNGGGEKSMVFAYIYFPKDKDERELLEKYQRADFDALFSDTAKRVLSDGINADIEGVPWLKRELIWHNAYLRAGMTYFDFYSAHILSQGGHYQYIMGLQGAPRDQLQHSLPYIYSDARTAKEHILFTLKEMSPEGELPYATTGNGLLISFVMVPSDLQLMLLSYVGEYVLAARDREFLHSSYTVKKNGKEVTRTVLEGVTLAYKYAAEKVGTGEHGLVRMKTGDWNDQAVYGRVPWHLTRTAQKRGESMLNSAIAIYAYRIFGEMLSFAGEKELAEDAKNRSEEIRKAVAAQWNGKWFKRAWLTEKVGWLGDDLLWLEPQPWAIIGEAADGEKAKILAGNIYSILSKDNPHGAQLISRAVGKGENSAGLDEGVLENGGIWYAINGYLVWALAKVNGELAFTEFLKNTRAAQAEAFPDIWYGIWSAPDSVNSVTAKYPGRTQNSKNPITGKREKFFKLTVGVDWEDYPVLNLHAHTWQQYALIKLTGLEFTAGGFKLKPAIPKERYAISSPLFSLSLSDGIFRCRYSPAAEGEYSIEFDPGGKTPVSLAVNGKSRPFTVRDGLMIFTAKGKEIGFEIKTEG